MNNPNCGRCGMLNHAGFCKLTACIYPCQTGMGSYINKPITNSDRLKSMSDEEFATAICKHDGCPFRKTEDNECLKHHYDCKACWLVWLKQEIDEGE